MMDFTGMTVKLTLKQPPNTVVQGKVQEVRAGQALCLEDVLLPSTGSRYGQWTVQGTAIADLHVIDADADTSQIAPQALGPSHITPQAPTPQPQCQSASFVDPAILTYHRSPLPSPFVPAQHGMNGKHGKRSKPKQRGKSTGAVPASADPPPVMNSEVSRNGNDMDSGAKRGKGWRQTPLLQPSPQPNVEAQTPGGQSSGRKKSRRQMQEEQETQNGWATEEATDIQDMPEFDFEANHKLFDKQTVFDELRAGDTTAEEERLVSHNKLPLRPGTYGGKNLHRTENVLTPKLGTQEVESASDADTELNLDRNGHRSSSKNSGSRKRSPAGSLPGKKPSRQNSAMLDDGRSKPHPLATSISSERGGLSRSVADLASSRGAKQSPSLATSSPKPDRMKSPKSAILTAEPPESTVETSEPHFVIKSNMQPCPVLHPSALETLEAETITRYGLTAEAVTESAGRCIAETALNMFDAIGGVSRRNSRANTMRGSLVSSTQLNATPLSPVVVILAGNHICGARALTAARLLASRNVRIILALHDDPASTSDQYAAQRNVLRNMSKARVADIDRGPWKQANKSIKRLPAPPTLIIDALLNGSLCTPSPSVAEGSHDDLREMIDWANRSRALVLSIACPSGVDGVDGSATVVEGEPLAVRPDLVLCLGAPVSGLLEALKAGDRWDVSVADVGINIALRKEEAVAFGSSWVASLAYTEDDGAV